MINLNFLQNRFWRHLTYDIAIDLGTANTLVYVVGKGIVLREPSTVAINKRNGLVLAVGQEAKKMIGKTPGSIQAIRPLRSGVISDFDVTEAMLKYFIRKVHRLYGLQSLKIPRPRVVIGVPSGITEVERKAVIDAATKGGARKVFLIEEAMAAAIGAELPIEEATANMIVDIGGGTSEIAVISLGGIVTSRSIRIAGDVFDEEITQWVKLKHNLLIGEKTAEELKFIIGNALPAEDENQQKKSNVRGRNLKTGLPQEIEIFENSLLEALEKPLNSIILNIKETIEETPPELISDLYRNGLILTGGGSMLKRFNQRIANETKIPVSIANDPLTTVVRGCGKVLEEIELLNKIKLN